MLYLIKFIYTTFLLPPGIWILFLLLLSGWLFLKRQRAFSLILFGLTVLLYINANPFFSNLLIHSLEYRYKPPERVGGDVIVMLGGGATLDSPNFLWKGHLSGAAANRLLTCIMLYRHLSVPIMISGGQVYQTTGREAEIAGYILKEAGIPGERILVENRSLNTTENAAFTRILLDRYHLRYPILVTSAFHMPRAVRQFQKAGLDVTPFPTDYHTDDKLKFIISDLIPSAGAMNDCSLVIKEYLGLLAAKWY